MMKRSCVNFRENKNSSAYLGKSKDSLELFLALDSAVALFGPFLRYHICSPQQQLPAVHNAFAVMIYYSAKYSPICIYCAGVVESAPQDKYPQCQDCQDKPEIVKA